MAYHFEHVKLEKGMYGRSGQSFAKTLEELDPSEHYRGTPLEGLDAFQRQLKRFGQESGEAALLRKQAAMGRKYLQALRKEVVRLAMLADDGLEGSAFEKAMDRLEEAELLELKRSYEAQAAKRFPAAPQLRRKCAEKQGDETVFLV